MSRFKIHIATLICFLLAGYTYAQGDKNNSDPEKLFNRGYHLLSVDPSLSIPFFNRVLELDSMSSNAYYYRGIAHYKLDHMDSALMDFNIANRMDQGLHLIHIYKGFIFRRLENYDSAALNFNKYILNNPHDTSAYSLVLRGKMKQEIGDFEGAIEDMDIAINLDPLKESYHYYKFQAYFDQGKFSKAREEIDNVLEINKNFYGYYYYKGNTYFEERRFNEAIKQYDIAIKMKVDNGDLYFHRGLAEKERNNNKAALLDFDTAIAYNENDGAYYFHRGYSKLALGNKIGACNDWYMAGALGYYEEFEKIKEVCEE